MNALDLCTDVAAMTALLERSLPGFAGGRARIEALSVGKVRRSSSVARNPHPITLCFELTVREGRRLGSVSLYAKMFRNGASAACFASIDASQLERPAWGDAVMHLPELDMVLWALPNDPGLPQLSAMLDAVRLHPLLPWAALGVDPCRARGLDVELLRHEPEQRATLRCTVELDGAAGPAPPRSLRSPPPEGAGPPWERLRRGPLVVYAKTFADSRGRAIDERFDHLWREAQHDPSAPLVARPLGWDERTRTAWQADARGTPLRDALAAADNADPLLAQVAQALARLHAAPLPAPHEHSIAHWVAEARRRRTKIARAVPDSSARVTALVERLEAQAAQLPPRPLSLIHADFHHDQVRLHEGRVVLFDFDEFALGDPMEDVAAFATRLDREDHAHAFIDAVAAQGGARFDRRTLDWHLALAALLQASRAFVFQRPGWRGDLERWLARAEACAADTRPDHPQPPAQGEATRQETFA